MKALAMHPTRCNIVETLGKTVVFAGIAGVVYTNEVHGKLRLFQR